MTLPLNNAGRQACETHSRGKTKYVGRREAGEQKFQARLVISTVTAGDVTIEGTVMATMTEDSAYLTTSEDGNVLQVGLPVVTEAGCLDSTHLDACAQLVDNERG